MLACLLLAMLLCFGCSAGSRQALVKHSRRVPQVSRGSACATGSLLSDGARVPLRRCVRHANLASTFLEIWVAGRPFPYACLVPTYLPVLCFRGLMRVLGRLGRGVSGRRSWMRELGRKQRHPKVFVLALQRRKDPFTAIQSLLLLARQLSEIPGRRTSFPICLYLVVPMLCFGRLERVLGRLGGGISGVLPRLPRHPCVRRGGSCSSAN